jgi:1-acyl-sn-glycerol-3-phosphate acyltransferase
MLPILRFIPATISLLVLAIAIVLCNLLQLLSFLLYPISPRCTRWITRACAAFWFNFLVFCLENILRVRIEESGDDLPRDEDVFFLANHQAMADVPVVVAIAKRRGRAGDTKWFVKDPLKWVPGVGWGLLMLDCLFVKRNWAADKARVTGVFSRLRHSGHGFWVMSFLEGTRATPAKLAKSQAYARRQGMTELRHLLMPRTKGFEATLAGLEGKIDAVYDCTIVYEGPPPNLLGLFYRTRKISAHLRRYPIEAVPKDDKGRALWVNELFVTKDRLVQQHRSSGSFRL